MGGWLEKMKIEQISASAGLKLAELGKKHRNSLKCIEGGGICLARSASDIVESGIFFSL